MERTWSTVRFWLDMAALLNSTNKSLAQRSSSVINFEFKIMFMIYSGALLSIIPTGEGPIKRLSNFWYAVQLVLNNSAPAVAIS